MAKTEMKFSGDVLLSWTEDQKGRESSCFLSSLAEYNLCLIVARHMILKNLCAFLTITMKKQLLGNDNTAES